MPLPLKLQKWSATSSAWNLTSWVESRGAVPRGPIVDDIREELGFGAIGRCPRVMRDLSRGGEIVSPVHQSWVQQNL